MGQRGPKSNDGKLTVLDKKQMERPKPLSGMRKSAREIWKRIVDAYPADHFKPQHLGLLRAYCETEADFKTAIQKIEKQGALLEQKNGITKRNPWCAERDALSSAMAQLGTKLGITRNATTMTKDNQGEAKPAKSKREGLRFSG